MKGEYKLIAHRLKEESEREKCGAEKQQVADDNKNGHVVKTLYNHWEKTPFSPRHLYRYVLYVETKKSIGFYLSFFFPFFSVIFSPIVGEKQIAFPP